MWWGPYDRTPFDRGPQRGSELAELKLEAFTGAFEQHQTATDPGFAELKLEAFVGTAKAAILVRDGGFGLLKIEPFGDVATKYTEDLYFIDQPSIQTQGILATHLLLISPTHTVEVGLEGIPIENRIEQVVEIDEGNEEILTQTGQLLLEKWGRPQISVTGVVDLVVTTHFRSMLRVWVPSANIDEFMPLQKKEHDIAAQTTRLTLGDLIVGQDEYLARILREQKG